MFQGAGGSGDYRRMTDKFPTILEGFYKAAEIGGYVGAREADAEAWSKHTTDAKT